MPQLLPFAGLRPDPGVVGPLESFVCPPYDVISEAQRRELIGRSRYNVVRVELPDGDYAGAAQLLAHWRATGALKRETAPALYGYRMTYPSPGGGPRTTTGVIGALVLEPPGKGILLHEQTTPKAKTDRLELIRATHANTSPIWCLCTSGGLTDALGAGCSATVARAVDEDGNPHEIWPITAASAHADVGLAIAAAPLLVADGHHRYETALAYQAEQPAGAQGPDAVLALVVALTEERLQVRAIHRVVSGLPAGTSVLAAFERDFELEASAASGEDLVAQMVDKHALAVLTSAGTWLARAWPGTPSASFELDSSRVDAVLSTLPQHQLAYEPDAGRAASEVRAGAAAGAVLCRPATVAQIAATARGGARMPPKTTFFWPKPRTGMVLRDW